MKLTKVPFHLVQQGLTKPPICKGAAPEWKITSIGITGNTDHHRSITSKMSAILLKIKGFIATSTVQESQTNKYVADAKAHGVTVQAGVQTVQ